MMQYHRIVLAGANPSITSYPELGGFEAAVAAYQADAKVPHYVIQSEADCEQLSIAEMVLCVNYLGTGKTIKSLHDRKAGAKRLWGLLTTRKDPDAETMTASKAEETSTDANNSLDHGKPSDYEGGTSPGDVSGDTTNEDTMTKKATKKAAAKSKAAKKSTAKAPRDSGKTAAISKLLQRANGCTRKDILEATGWKAVSVQQMAKACGLKLSQTKEKGEVTRYFGK